jgi:acyl-CoA thioester hydrolase
MSGSARSRPLGGDFPYRHAIEIRYADTDALGHVNNATYFSYFEAARAGYYAQVSGHAFGTGPDAKSSTFVIAEAHITYRQPALFGEPMWCSCRVGWVGRSSFSFEYRVEVGDSPIGEARTAADGSTVQVFYDLESGKVMRIPAELMEQITVFEGRPLPTRAAQSRTTG